MKKMQPINSTTNIVNCPLSVVVTQSGNVQPRQVLVTPVTGGLQAMPAVVAVKGRVKDRKGIKAVYTVEARDRKLM